MAFSPSTSQNLRATRKLCSLHSPPLCPQKGTSGTDLQGGHLGFGDVGRVADDAPQLAS